MIFTCFTTEIMYNLFYINAAKPNGTVKVMAEGFSISNLRYLQYLDAVYRHKNLTKASEELYVSQPAISAAITAMETKLGYKLLVRGAKGVTFTLEGEQLIPYIQNVLEGIRETEAAAAELSSSGNSFLRLGISPTLGIRMLMHKVYSDFLPSRPNAEIFLYEGSMGKQIIGVKEGAIDMSFNALPSRSDPELKIVPISFARINAIMRLDHPLAERNSVSVTDLGGDDIVLLDEKSATRQIVLDCFRKNGVIPKIVSSHEQVLGLLEMVKYRNCIGFINADPGEDVYSDLVVMPLQEKIGFSVGFIYSAKSSLPKIGKELISFAKEMYPAGETGEN